MSYQPVNLWDEVNNPKGQEFEYWGKISMAAHQVVLMKGVGKVAYEPGMKMPDGSEPRPVVAIKIGLEPLPEMNSRYPVEREYVAVKNGEWGDITLPSIRDCGIMQVETLAGKFARASLTGTGRKYTNQQGEEKEATTLKFLAVFNTEQECRQNYQTVKGGNGHAAAAAPVQPAPAPQAATAGNGNGNGKEAALKFLKVFVTNAWKASGGDMDKAMADLNVKIASQQILSKHFTGESPEVMDFLAAEMAK